MEQAAVRATAAAGLLRLARHRDEAVPVELFHRVALTLQDPVLEVRRGVAAKLHRAICWLQVRFLAMSEHLRLVGIILF